MKVENKCPKCGAVILYAQNVKTGKSDMVNQDGTSHLCAGVVHEVKVPVAQAPVIDAEKAQAKAAEPVVNALPRVPTIEEMTGSSSGTSVVIHRHEGTDQNRPDSITFADSTKVPGLKIYVDFQKPEEVMDLIDEAFVAYGYALNKFAQIKAEKPELFPLGAKA